MESKVNFKVIGLMSGTSLDGLDIAYCHFTLLKGQWSYALKKAKTIKYSSVWRQKLATAHENSGEALIELDVSYGKWLGKVCLDFIKENRIRVDFIASHGHTVFHQPKKGFTFQLGNGTALYAVCGKPVVSDFRSLDVMFGGEGAPLVPVGDKLLFSAYDVCLNLGGIANLSADLKGRRIAYDLCFMNMGLNYLMNTMGKEYDKGGELAATGTLHQPMLIALNKVYASLRKKRPSMGRELFQDKIKPILDAPHVPLADKLRTIVTSSSQEIALALRTLKQLPTVLCTGGGTFNYFLISTLLEQCGDEATFIIPEDDLVKFKEAVVFGFLGVLNLTGQENCLRSVTGASRSSVGGTRVGFD